MKKKSIVSFASLLLLFSLFIGGSISHVFASGMDYEIENQQKSKYVDRVYISFKSVPPNVTFYNTSDGFAGYLGRDSYYFNTVEKEYVGIYSGYVYDRPPYPSPTRALLDE
ncbi:MAG TPA: hypothetical protein VK093_00180 [Candidatus Avipropionibacterium sp.]|nr:hypothetical protein [Candidatus Avipropionibacterium sp.]